MAGMASIAYLDLVIGSVVTCTVIVAVPVLLQKAGGWSTVTASLPVTHFQVLGDYDLARRPRFDAAHYVAADRQPRYVSEILLC